MVAPWSEDLAAHLDEHGIPHDRREPRSVAGDDVKAEQFEAVKRWFEHDWTRIEPKLRTSIVEGISVFLSLFDDNPAVKRTFCPPEGLLRPRRERRRPLRPSPAAARAS